jgi:signal transduction histidine kinase
MSGLAHDGEIAAGGSRADSDALPHALGHALARALARIRQLESEIVEIADRERRRLGADLHDGLGQQLTGIALMLRAVVKRAGPGAASSMQLEEIIGLVNHSIESTRSLSFGLSPATIGAGGLPGALQTLIGWSRDSYQVDVRLHLAFRSPPRIAESAAGHLYLMAQEAINNAVRHGSARCIVVTLRSNRTRIALSIQDDGAGLANAASRGPGVGLEIMRYRSSLIGAAMRIKNLPGGGTRLRIVCPHESAGSGL